MPVRNKLKEFVEGKGLSIYQFWQDVGISRTTAYSLSNDASQLPNSSVLHKICDHYRIQPCEILQWIPPEELKEEI